MKKVLRNGIKFICTALVVYLILFAILFFIAPGGVPLIYRTTKGNSWEGGGTYVKFKDFDSDKKWDIIILGSSHAYRGYDPRIFDSEGFNTFNLGTSDQNMMCSYYIAKNYIRKDNCKMVILDMYDRVFTQNNLESISDVVHNVTSDKTAFQVALSSRDIRGLNMFVLRQFNKLREPMNSDTSGFIKGFYPTQKTLAIPVKKRITWKYTTNEFQIRYLKKLIEYLEQENIKLVLVEHPMPAIYAPKDHELFVQDVSLIANRYNIPFIDYMSDSTLTGLNYFADETHLNIHGAKKFNLKLINEMKLRGILPEKETSMTATDKI
jgi:hypothetical protein